MIKERNLSSLCCVLMIVTQDGDAVAVENRGFLLLQTYSLGRFSTSEPDCDISEWFLREWVDHSVTIILSVSVAFRSKDIR